jgi:hypothetical protein
VSPVYNPHFQVEEGRDLWSSGVSSDFSSLDMARSSCVSVLRGWWQYQMLSLAHVVFAFRSYQKCQILSANDDLEFPVPACGALLPLAPIGARIQPLPFAPPSPFGRPAAVECLAQHSGHSAQQAARGTLLMCNRPAVSKESKECQPKWQSSLFFPNLKGVYV